MPWVRLNNFEYAGYVADVDAHLLPPNLVSRLENAHGVDGVLCSYSGYNTYSALTPEEIYWLLSGGFTSPWLLGAGASTIESLTLTGTTDITPTGGLSAAGKGSWTGGVLHGLAILNNGVDAPLYWNGTGEAAALSNWVSGETCGTLRPFKNFLFAGNISTSTDDYPTKVRWSHPADPGALPSSWDDTDPTVDAGSLTLSDTPGVIVDFQAGLNSMFCYKEDAVHEFTYIGGVYIFRATPRFYEFGLMAKNCTFTHRGITYAFGANDIVRHTSTEMASIATKAIRRKLYGSLQSGDLGKCFVMYDPESEELLFCVPMGADSVNYAYTFNPATGKWGERQLALINHGVAGKTLAVDGSWTSDSNTWDSDDTIWNQAIAQSSQIFLGGTQLHALNELTSFNGAAIPVVMERRSIDFGTEQAPNERIKFVSRIRPNIIAVDGTQVQVQVGSQMRLGDPVSWGAAQTFTVGTTLDLCCRVNGRYLSWRISATGDVAWKLESIDFEVKQGAMW